ncbi:hypothetical protein [Undibacterium sp. Ji49W]|uniref:hypothetical protein n=1 Tax=Undibacterium sp. Ji49W TaxID=3413040 RepID=UPI003BF321BC
MLLKLELSASSRQRSVWVLVIHRQKEVDIIKLARVIAQKGRNSLNTKLEKITIACFFSTILLISGCDRRPITKSDMPFSLGGIYIGIPKSEVDRAHKLLPCKTESKAVAECYLDDTEQRYDFLGASTSYAKLKLRNPYESVSEIEFSTKGKIISKSDIESKWGIKGRCLSKNDIEEAVKFDGESTSPFVRYLNEINLIPSNYGSFICIAANAQVLQYKNYGGQDGSASIFYLQEIWVRNFEHIFEARARMAGAKEEIDQKLNNSVATHEVKINLNTCKNYEYGADTYHDNMEKLAKIVGRKDGYYDRSIESYVGSLCAGKTSEAQSMVNDGSVDREEAQAIRKILSQ